jgi:threonine dehydrogenase-like Zn-dependent dehydrogenase
MGYAIKAVVFPGTGEVELQNFELPAVGATDVLVRSLYTMVSPGTELRGWRGTSGFPMVPGYATIGEVIEVGARVEGYRVGDLVSGRSCKRFFGEERHTCGGHASAHLFPTTGEDRAVLLPAGAKALDYVIAEISSICRRGAEAARPLRNETAVVIGQGLIGALAAAWLQVAGCQVVVTDLEQGRLDRALARGAFAAVSGREPDAGARIQAHLNGGADIVVEGSGSSAGAHLAYSLVRGKPRGVPYVEGAFNRGEPIATFVEQWPRLVMQASYIEKVEIDPHGYFPGEGMVVLTPGDRSLDDRQKAVRSLWQGDLRAADFVDRIVRPAEAPEAYRSLRDDKDGTFSVVFDWSKA